MTLPLPHLADRYEQEYLETWDLKPIRAPGDDGWYLCLQVPKPGFVERMIMRINGYGRFIGWEPLQRVEMLPQYFRGNQLFCLAKVTYAFEHEAEAAAETVKPFLFRSKDPRFAIHDTYHCIL